MKNLRPLLCFILLVSSLFAHPQKHHIQFDHLGTDEGLSQSNVLCILQDSRGFMWFGTRDGLNKYDGYKFTLFKNDQFNTNSISNNFIEHIIEDKNGDLWIATLGGGVCRFNRNTELFTRYQHDPANTNSISSDVVLAVLQDAQGKLWMGTETGLDRYDPATKTFVHFTNDPTNKSRLSDSYIRFIYEDSHKNIWICTRYGGINLYNPQTNSFTRFQHNEKDTNTISGNNGFCVFEDSKLRLWIGTDGNGLELLDRKTGIFTHFIKSETNTNSIAANVIYAINEDAENNLWVGTENGGLSILNHSTGVFTNYKNDEIDWQSISNNSIYSIYRDTKNNMWLGSFSSGIDLVNRDKTRFSHYKHMMQKNSLSDNHVLSIAEDTKKNIWIGTDGGGLNLFDPVQGNFTHFRHEKNNEQSIAGDYVLTTCEDSKGNIWIGTWGAGISVFNPSNNSFKQFKHDPANRFGLSDNNVWKIYEDHDNNIWVGTFGGGLELLNPDRNSFTHYQFHKDNPNGISSIYITCIFEDSNGVLWAGTDGGGLNRFNKESNTFTRFGLDKAKNSISNNTLNDITEDSDKNLWIATRVGLNRYNKKTNRFTVYTTADGLPDNVIFSILDDHKGNLWISTNRGISRYNILTNRFKNFGVSDGLQSNEFKPQAAARSSSGMMYFGGNNGFNQFVPEKILPYSFEPPLVITSLLVLNKEVAIGADKNDLSPLTKTISETESITLPYSNSVFSFEFASLNYTSSDKRQYAYMLENFDKDWNEIGKARTATYTNLNPGRYLFKVKGLNNDGNWSSRVKTIEVIIRPPFWLTWWFKLAAFAAITGTAVMFYFQRINTVRKQQVKLQQLVDEQTHLLLLSTHEEHKARKEADDARIDTENANKELKIKNIELEQFAYVASHDLQEPLRTTASFVELIQRQYRGKLDEKADKYLEYIADASYRMKVLIKDLLDFSRIGVNVALKKTDCNVILKNMLEDIQAAITESGAIVIYSRMPEINCYPSELKQLFQNLVLNSIKFRNPGIPPQINITAAEKDFSWQFAVSDNGIGIEKQYSERIFIIFQRLHTRSKYAGSGIGLSHCKKIVELHNGKIWVESMPGKGSTFHFTIHKNAKWQQA
ncbi:MAG: rcsC 4 [Ferruginibacter sp.]|nr:rcsC 4 [Ferruginibacter sp.]